MFIDIIKSCKVFLLLMVIDSVWLLSMGQRFYRKWLGHVFADNVQYSWAILFYFLYAIALTYFIITPYAQQPYHSSIRIFLEGFLFGLVAYSAYDLTNQATIKGWPLVVTVVDMLWGATLTGIVVFLACKFIK